MKKRIVTLFVITGLLAVLTGCGLYAAEERLDAVEDAAEAKIEAMEDAVERRVTMPEEPVPTAEAPQADAPAAKPEPMPTPLPAKPEGKPQADKPTEKAQDKPTEKPQADAPAARLTKEEAESIALSHAGLTVGEVTRLHTEYDVDDGVPEYDVDFHAGGFEYDYEIHAETGAVLRAEKERED